MKIMNKKEIEELYDSFAPTYESHAKNIGKYQAPKKMSKLIETEKNARIDYIDFVNPDNLLNVQRIESPTRILLAIWMGDTRLIDNMEVKP